MSTAGRPSSADREADLGSPQSPALIRHKVRKRANPVSVANPFTISSPHRGINTRLIYNDYKPKGPTSTGIQIRNFFAFLLVFSLPAFIFVLPLWRQPSPELPRLVLALRTTPERLSSNALQPILDHLLSEQPDKLLLILPSLSNDNDPTLPTIPTYLQIYLDDSNLADSPAVKLVHTSAEYGSAITSIMITALSEEKQGQEPNDSSDLDSSETRILMVDDRYPLPSIPSLLQSSLKYPDDVLSPVGGNWRSYFRQIKWILEPNSPLNQFPNVVLHTVTVSSTVDLVDSSRGIIFRAGLLLPHLSVLKERLEHLMEEMSSDHKLDSKLLHVEAEDVLYNALLETLSIARRVIPWAPPEDDRNKESNITGHLLTTPVYSRQHWMTAAFQLQKEWNVWNKYSFWDYEKFTPKQREAMDCESRYQPSCPNQKNYRRGVASYCQPNPQYCGELSEFGSVWNTFAHAG